MTDDDRDAWIKTCVGSDVSVDRAGDARGLRYSAFRWEDRAPEDYGPPNLFSVYCALRWDPRRRRVDAMSVRIRASDAAYLTEDVLAAYVELVTAEMTYRDREAANVFRSATFANGSLQVQSRAFTVARERKRTDGYWSWTVAVQAR